jgi:hypothetical protein
MRNVIAALVAIVGVIAALAALGLAVQRFGTGSDDEARDAVRCVEAGDSGSPWEVRRHVALRENRSRESANLSTLAPGGIVYQRGDGRRGWLPVSCVTEEGTLEGWVHRGSRENPTVVRLSEREEEEESAEDRPVENEDSGVFGRPVVVGGIGVIVIVVGALILLSGDTRARNIGGGLCFTAGVILALIAALLM